MARLRLHERLEAVAISVAMLAVFRVWHCCLFAALCWLLSMKPPIPTHDVTLPRCRGG